MSFLDHLTKDLGLPKGDAFTQDWAYELPEEFRTKEWLKKYISAYSENHYTILEKNSLMELMIDIINDFLIQGTSFNDTFVTEVLDLLFNNYQSHLQLIEHWSLDGEPLENCFALTPEIRQIKKRINS
ncbi:hypothetical protein [Xenorhabdus bovienii]|uniref:hypothetical protein n=1 Tax=Xenorhabdus bovienii TaxID=40576 RepID=UPI0023B318A7|nr:hypothetical protein [Xenorhabdus bovienii]MDE9542825.1 hypothetical protein [Xenorhabdus bovienii]